MSYCSEATLEGRLRILDHLGRSMQECCRLAAIVWHVTDHRAAGADGANVLDV